jgi:hypothetical protein
MSSLETPPSASKIISMKITPSSTSKDAPEKDATTLE